MSAASPPCIGIDARKIRDYGIGRYLAGLLRGFAALGGEERFVLFLAEPSLAHLPEPLPGVLDPRRFFPVSCRAPLYSLQELYAFRGAAQRYALSLLHFPHYVRAFSPGCPVAVTVHDPIHLLHPPSLAARLYARAMMGWSARSSAVLLTVTHSVRDDLARLLGTDRERWHVTPNGVGEEFSPPAPPDVAAFRDERELPERFVLCVASHRSHKNLAGAIAGFASAELPGATLVVPARDEPAARQLAARLESAPEVRLLAPVSDAELPLLYAAASVVFIPSHYEGFGLPGLEAMACGAAVVASGIPAHREVLGQGAYLAASSQPEDLAAALREVWTDPARRQALAARGVERSRAFSWETTARLTLAAYREALV
jgi:glycosyltransferase involved in cell wall biosynthesis